jgi:hypothetical protein
MLAGKVEFHAGAYARHVAGERQFSSPIRPHPFALAASPSARFLRDMASPTSPPPLPGQKKGSVWPYIGAALGFIVLVSFALLAAHFAQQLKKKQAASQAAIEEIETSAATEREKMADSIEKGETSGSDEAIGRMKAQLEKSAGQMSPDDAAAARALTGYLSQMQTQAKTYEAALARFLEAEILAFKSTDHATLVAHRQIVADFAAANEQLTGLVARSEEIVRAALINAKVPNRTLEATMNGFNKGRAQRQLQLRIRAHDRTLGETSLAAIDLLEKNRGRWSRDEASGQLSFQDDATLKTFNELMEKVQHAADEQTKAQQELAAQMRAMGN